ncbi:hypothetical protein M513_06818, partial [Trichuris suis]
MDGMSSAVASRMRTSIFSFREKNEKAGNTFKRKLNGQNDVYSQVTKCLQLEGELKIKYASPIGPTSSDITPFENVSNAYARQQGGRERRSKMFALLKPAKNGLFLSVTDVPDSFSIGTANCATISFMEATERRQQLPSAHLILHVPQSRDIVFEKTATISQRAFCFRERRRIEFTTG